MRTTASAELLVFDGQERCPYLPEQHARMPLRYPLSPLLRADFDRAMELGDRRCGSFLYRTECPQCRACEPIRLPVAEFSAHRTQARIFRRGEQLLRCEITTPLVDQQHLDLFNKHRKMRGLSSSRLDARQYASFLVETCCETFELQYWAGDHLVAVAITDRGATSLSAVYCYYDPEFARLSPGVYSILKQIELCRRWQLAYLYLGLYVAGNAHMKYKANYRPHQRLVNGCWRRFD